MFERSTAQLKASKSKTSARVAAVAPSKFKASSQLGARSHRHRQPSAKMWLAFTCVLLSWLSTSPDQAFAEESKKPKKGRASDAPALHFDADYFRNDRIQVDGLTNDWEGSPEPLDLKVLTSGEYEYDWTGEPDLSAAAEFAYRDDGLYGMIRVWDQTIVGEQKGKKGDRIELLIDIGPLAKKSERIRRLIIDPSYLNAEDIPDLWWEEPRALSKQSSEPLMVSGALFKGGYIVEFGLPFAEFTPLPPTFAPTPICIIVRDWDRDDKREEEATVSSCPALSPKAMLKRIDEMGTLRWPTRSVIWAGITNEFPDYSPDKAVSAFGNIGGDARTDEAAGIGRELFVLGQGLGPGEWYRYSLGLKGKDEVVGIRLHDFNADGANEIVLTTRHFFGMADGDISQDIVSVFTFDGENGISDPILRVEIANRGVNGEVVSADVTLKKGTLSVKANSPEGWTEDTYVDVDGGDPGEAYHGMVLPWEKKKASYRYKDGAFQ